jgi:hypothetical protein
VWIGCFVEGRPTVTAVPKEADYPTILLEGREISIKPEQKRRVAMTVLEERGMDQPVLDVAEPPL